MRANQSKPFPYPLKRIRRRKEQVFTAFSEEQFELIRFLLLQEVPEDDINYFVEVEEEYGIEVALEDVASED